MSVATDIAQTRVEEDAKGRRTRFEEIEVGRDLGSLEWTVTPEDIEKQCAADEDYDDAYFLETFLETDGIRIAPPQIQYRPPRWLLSRTYNIRGVFYRWEFENRRPIRCGETLTIKGRVADKWIKNEREFVAFEFVAESSTGEVVFLTRRTHALDVIRRTAPRSGEGVDSGVKPERL
jgi:acyl dehydratase